MRCVVNRIGPFLLAVATLSLAAGATSAGELVGRVVSIHDGDTLTVLVDRRQVKVRLTEIDAPEKKQPFGNRSKQSLADLCYNKSATFETKGEDRFGRTLARVACAGVDVNAEQVHRGMAWVFDRYAPKGSPLYKLEQDARLDRRGLWADDAAVPPWEWRRANV